MNNKVIIIIASGLIGMLVGIVGTGLIAKRGMDRFDRMGEMKGMMDHSMHGGMKGQMDGMMMELEGKKGDDFDRAFLREMIVHHEGAVEMAESALQNAKHQEIRDLSSAIISAQEKEIGQMKEWESEWYGE